MTGLEAKVIRSTPAPTLHADHERPGSTRGAPDLDKDGHLCIQQVSGSGNGTTGVVYNVEDNSRPLSRQGLGQHSDFGAASPPAPRASDSCQVAPTCHLARGPLTRVFRPWALLGSNQ